MLYLCKHPSAGCCLHDNTLFSGINIFLIFSSALIYMSLQMDGTLYMSTYIDQNEAYRVWEIKSCV